jgi:ribonucleoside-diphosphate reductase alpha chain
MHIAKVSSTLSGTNTLPTMPIPADLRAQPISLTENARTVLRKRYLRRGEDGKPVETEQEMFWRVAYHVALSQQEFNTDVESAARRYYHLLSGLQFFPNSPTFTGAGTPLGQLAACFVLGIDDDMGRGESGIFQTLRNAALIQQTGGGNGFAFSRLRPKGALVKSSAGQATGPIGFLRVYDQAFGEIAQGGSRRGANMAVLRVDHPDIREFITCKTDESKITNFNISVGITDAFMRAVEIDGPFDLVNPQDGKVWETVRAREIFDLIVKYAHHNGEPGVLFLDAANRSNPVPHLYQYESTNPCFIGSTRIATDRGLITIQALAEDSRAFMVATDARAPFGGIGLPGQATYGVAFRHSSPAWKTRQNVPVFKLATSHGYSVTATADHKFLTSNKGYVELSDLRSGDTLLLQSGEGAWSQNDALPTMVVAEQGLASMGKGSEKAATQNDFASKPMGLPTKWSHDLGMVLGWLVGTAWPSETHTVIADAMKTLFAEKPASAHFFETLGLGEFSASEKRLPSALWNAPREAVVGFLQALFTSDGTVHCTPGKGDFNIQLASPTMALLEDVQVLLSNFGIISSLQPTVAQANYALILEGVNCSLFVERIGFFDTAKQTTTAELVALRADKITPEAYETTITSIEPAGQADVYDLTEIQTHSVIANGVVAHQCGEQFLGDFENCCLGSINLATLPLRDGKVDWTALEEITIASTRFLDDVVSANSYVAAVPQLAEAAHRVRRIGLGIMGLADLMYKLGVRYGSEEGQEFAGQVMEFVRYHAMRTSIEMAKERGAFPAITGSIYDPENLTWKPPVPLFPFSRDWHRPALDWNLIVAGIKQHGIRNGAQTTVAPTGTIATVSGCEGYGCEPVFALAYLRHVNDNGKDLVLQYTSPMLEAALSKTGLSDAEKKNLIDVVSARGTCQGVPGMPANIEHTFVVSSDITVDEHIRMQGAMQAFVDNAISKTVNAPEETTTDDVAKAYFMGWKLGCKGLTVYVTGSRNKVVLETHATAKSKEAGKAETPVVEEAVVVAKAEPTSVEAVKAPKAPMIYHNTKKPRPRRLEGRTYRVGTPLGGAYITVNENGQGKGHPFELFIHTSKAGSETAAVSEALGRLSSLILRMASPISPRERLQEIVRQLEGIGGERSIGFGPHRVRSLPDGVAQVLKEYLEETDDQIGLGAEDEPALTFETIPAEPAMLHSTNKVGANAVGNSKFAPLAGDLCPECGEASVINEEGCRKCYNCGYSEC